MSDIDEGSLGYSVMKAMESDLFKEMKDEEDIEEEVEE